MAGQSTKHILIVAPAERIDKFGVLKKLAGKFDAFIGERKVVVASRTPFCDGARALLADGMAQPTDLLVMRHAASEHDALKATVAVAAKLTVDETASTGTPRFVPHRPFEAKMGKNVGVRADMRETGDEAFPYAVK